MVLKNIYHLTLFIPLSFNVFIPLSFNVFISLSLNVHLIAVKPESFGILWISPLVTHFFSDFLEKTKLLSWDNPDYINVIHHVCFHNVLCDKVLLY